MEAVGSGDLLPQELCGKKCYTCLQEAVNTADLCLSFSPLIFKNREDLGQLREREGSPKGNDLWTGRYTRKALGMFWVPAVGQFGCRLSSEILGKDCFPCLSVIHPGFYLGNHPLTILNTVGNHVKAWAKQDYISWAKILIQDISKMED